MPMIERDMSNIFASWPLCGRHLTTWPYSWHRIRLGSRCHFAWAMLHNMNNNRWVFSSDTRENRLTDSWGIVGQLAFLLGTLRASFQCLGAVVRLNFALGLTHGYVFFFFVVLQLSVWVEPDPGYIPSRRQSCCCISGSWELRDDLAIISDYA